MKIEKTYLVKVVYTKKTQFQVKGRSAKEAINKVKKLMDNYPIEIEDEAYDYKKRIYTAFKLD